MTEEKGTAETTEIKDLTIAAISLFILILFLFAVYANEKSNETPNRCYWPGVMSCSPRGEVQFCTASKYWEVISRPCICAISEDQVTARCITTTVDAGLQIRD